MASTTSMELIKRDASNRIAAASRRNKTQGLERMLVRKASLVGAAGLYGALNRYNVPVDIGGFPYKLAVSTIANLTEAMTGGNLQAVAAGIADATTAIYIERAVTTGSVIAGLQEVGAGDGGNYIDVQGEDPDGGQL